MELDIMYAKEEKERDEEGKRRKEKEADEKGEK